MIVAQVSAADVDAVGALALRVGDREFGEDRLIPEVFQEVVLFAAELSPQLDLPGFERHFRGLVQPRQLGGFALFALAAGRWRRGRTGSRSGLRALEGGGGGLLWPPLHNAGL